MTGTTETEVKIRVPDLTGLMSRLESAGLSVSVPRSFEANTLYDTPDEKLRNQRMLLRLRQVGERAVITWKGPPQPGPHKSRPEFETTIGSLDTLDYIFKQLGLQPKFRYEKYRTEFTNKDDVEGVVTVDETPIGTFLELEGPGDWIDEMAGKLGFSPRNYILDSYGTLYLADCKARGVQPGHMVFQADQ